MTGSRIAKVLVTVLALAALGWLARAPYAPWDGGDGLLRLSWRLRGDKIESCRRRTQAELDALPAHMRTPEICEGHRVAYRLTVQIDKRPPQTSRVRPGGARGDRPIFVFHETRLPPGPHRVRVSFTRDDGKANTRAAALLALDTVLHTSAGVIDLITLNDAGHMILRRAVSR